VRRSLRRPFRFTANPIEPVRRARRTSRDPEKECEG
jgi:hypothetical protein